MRTGCLAQAVVLVSLRNDRRGRVPFAFIGAVLLLTSSLYSVTMAPPATDEPIADEIRDDAQVEARFAIESAIRSADRAAATEPVLDPHVRDGASVLPEENTTRQALALRIAHQAREVLPRTVERDGVNTTVSLPPIRNRAEAREAVAAVSIRSVGSKRYRVTIEDVIIESRRPGGPVDRSTVDVTITTHLAALQLHERMSRYEERLEAGVVEEGLTRDLTARLFPVVWVRGYAQYGGAPIENVLANRHVELLTNDALLAQQAATFGTADPDGRQATGVAAAEVASRDLFLGGEEALKSQLTAPQGEQPGAGEPDGSPSVPVPGVVGNEQEVNADAAAEKAFLEYTDGPLERTVDEVYRGDVRVRSHSRAVGYDSEPFEPPPRNMTLVDSWVSEDRWVTDGELEDGQGSTLRTYEATVVEERTRSKLWAGNNTRTTTERVKRTEYAVSLELTCRYRPAGIAPDGADSRCPFESDVRENLAEAGLERLLSPGEREERALEALDGGGGSDWQTIDLDPPSSAERRAQRETADLREELTDVSVSLETRSMASATNPASELAETIRSRRGELLEAPDRYDSAADRAATAARVRYLDRVVSELTGTTAMVDRAQNALADQLAAHAIPASQPEHSTPARESYVTSVEAGPSFLSADPPSGAEPRLAARNVNLFTVPYGEAADAVNDGIGGGSSSISLRTAAQTLAAHEAAGTGGEASQLRRDLANIVDTTADRYRSILSREVGKTQADRAVERGLGRFDGTAERALALADGRLAAAVSEELPASVGSLERDRLAVALRQEGREQATSVEVDRSVLEDVRSATQEGADPLLEETTKAAGRKAGSAAWEEATGRSVGSLPSGLPLLPVPGYWFATANAWTVSVRGGYDEFRIATPRTTPGRTPAEPIEYVRRNETVAVDYDGDGDAEPIGTNRQVTFEAHTGVVIVVPPGGTGVGDVDGEAIETSPAW